MRRCCARDSLLSSERAREREREEKENKVIVIDVVDVVDAETHCQLMATRRERERGIHPKPR